MTTKTKKSRRIAMRQLFSLSLVLTVALFVFACTQDDPTPTPVPTQAPAVAATTAPQSQAEPTSTLVPAPTAATDPEPDSDPISVVATTSIVGEWASAVGGDRVEVFNLVPRGADPHSFQPGARDIARVADADAVFAVGLSLEDAWLFELVENAAANTDEIVMLAEHVGPIEFGEDEHAHEDEHADEVAVEYAYEDEMEYAAEDAHASPLVGRLLIGDADSSDLHVLDLSTESISTVDFDVPGPASAVYASPNHRFGYILYRGEEGVGDGVTVVDGGVYLVPHGDHEDLVTNAITKMDLHTDDERPIHFTNGYGVTAIFNDGTGRVAIFDEHEMEEDYNDYEIQYLNTGLQHGAAVPLGNDLFAVTVANPDYPDVTPSSLPIGVEIRNIDDEIVYSGSSESCPGMHGESHNHSGSMYGCVGGVLFIEHHDDHFDHWFIENPDDLDEAARFGTVYGHDDSEHFFGKATASTETGRVDAGIWLIDPEGQEISLALAPSETKNSVTSSFSSDGSTLYVLTYDGMINAIDAHDGDVVGEAKLTDPITPGETPTFIIVEDTLFLSDRVGQKIVMFDLDHMEVEEQWALDATPTRLAYLGLVTEEDHLEIGHEDHTDEDAPSSALIGRLLIGDADSSDLHALDLSTESISTVDFDVPGPASAVYASPNHRFGYILYRGEEGVGDGVTVVDGGVYLVPHGDHEDLVTNAITKMDLHTDDERPIHFTNGYGVTAIFNDGTGRVAIFDEHEMEEDYNDYEIQYLNTGLQHGAAVPLGNDLFAVTVANPDYPDVTPSSLPIGVEIRNIDDEIVYSGSSESCPGMHGESHNHSGSMYGCVGGVLFIEHHDDHFDHWFIENPDDLDEAARFGTVYGHDDSEHFFGKATASTETGRVDAGIWLIDPEGQEISLALAPSETKNSVTSSFSSDGSTLYVLTYDGMINAIDAHDGDVVGEAKLTDPITPGETPTFIIVEDTLFLSDRVGQKIVMFDLDHMEVEEQWALDATPTRLAYLGLVTEEDHLEIGHEDHTDEDEHMHEDEDALAHHDHDHGTHDPHFWFDPQRAKVAIDEIVSALSTLDPDSADRFVANATAYKAELDELDAWIVERVSEIPEDDRILVTTHDAFGYLANRYGFEVAGVILPGGGTEVEPTARELAALVETIEHQGARAVFAEVENSDRLALAVARETDVKFVKGLSTGSLGAEGSPTATYDSMVRNNVNIIVDALSR